MGVRESEMIGKLKIGLLYVMLGIIVFGAFYAGHMSITPEADRLADPNDVAEITEPV